MRKLLLLLCALAMASPLLAQGRRMRVDSADGQEWMSVTPDTTNGEVNRIHYHGRGGTSLDFMMGHHQHSHAMQVGKLLLVTTRPVKVGDAVTFTIHADFNGDVEEAKVTHYRYTNEVVTENEEGLHRILQQFSRTKEGRAVQELNRFNGIHPTDSAACASAILNSIAAACALAACVPEAPACIAAAAAWYSSAVIAEIQACSGGSGDPFDIDGAWLDGW